jgi:hypothetical protein
VRRLDMLGIRHAPRLGRRPVGRVPDGRAVRGRLQDEEARLDALALWAARASTFIAECAVWHVVEVVPEPVLWGVRVRLCSIQSQLSEHQRSSFIQIGGNKRPQCGHSPSQTTSVISSLRLGHRGGGVFFLKKKNCIRKLAYG